MMVSCHQCKIAFHKSPSQIRERNFCSNACRLQWWGAWTIENVNVPGHSKGHKAPHLTQINRARTGKASADSRYSFSAYEKLSCFVNPMHDPLIRAKVGDKLRDRGEGRTYRKRHGRHEHRVVAEQMLGRSLVKDEVVHHIDGDKRNNNPENLMIVTRAEHARIHFCYKHDAVHACAGGGD